MRKSANNYFFVCYWLTKYGLETDNPDVTAKMREDGKWVCNINLPLINKEVTSVARTEVNAMYNSSNKAAKLIEEYILLHPELHIKNIFKGTHYIFEEDSLGRFLSAMVSHEQRLKEGKMMTKQLEDSLRIIEKAIEKIEKINRVTKGLFLQVVDKSCINNKDDDKNICRYIHDKVIKVSENFVGYTYVIKNRYVVSLGEILDGRDN